MKGDREGAFVLDPILTIIKAVMHARHLHIVAEVVMVEM